ncbi:hypothetical protein FV140_15680 [Paenarthrobacter ureafaciens]|nr:hypothetical protein AUT26_14085 [Arthrobacter sp. ATCC 21022]NKR10007.1 hypothetical protein [Arthrobacter sp. M5]NKR14690.1 hypothetical protein [Arthrobacter sp. M6]OEH60169.1 hypothetical protein A5N13_04085 [Arthrobacter sp. D4]OEH60784.1 hypothetical protein A5N17_15120 [Arthrobacter sp. D2]QMU83368.1 hypothetical protein FV140_15680 [Paenarthrobacter ureafaciens]
MAPGIYGADITQLRSLSKVMGTSGNTLANLELNINGIVASAAWKGADGDRFRADWSSKMRPMLHKASESLRIQAKALLVQADEQEQASQTGSGTSPGQGPTPAQPSTPFTPVVDANGNTVYQSLNFAASGSGFIADVLLNRMAQGGLLSRMPWSVLGAQYGQMPGVGYVRGTQLLNGLSMVGRAAGVLSVVGGVAQFADGYMRGDGYAMADGGITTVLAAGSFVPVVGPFFAGASLAWAGMGFLAKGLGYGSTSEMVVDGAKAVAGAVEDGAQAIADGAKKVWGWLGG